MRFLRNEAFLHFVFPRHLFGNLTKCCSVIISGSSSPSSTHVFSTSSIIPSTTVDVTSTSTIATISATPRTTSSASSQSLPPPSQPFQAPTSSQTPIDATSTAKPTLTYTTSTATQMLSRATSTVNQTLSHAAPTVNQTAVLSTTRTTPQNVEVTMTQVTITSVMNTQSINASSVTIPLLPVSPGKHLNKPTGEGSVLKS